jgi:lipopolysaccharide biosynthesis glycosyltransferase
MGTIIFLDGVPEKEKLMLVRTHQLCHKGSSLEIVDYTPEPPAGGKLLHGNSTCYGRIRLATLLPDEARCIYLDCDLLVKRCILDIFEYFDGEHIILADGARPLSRSFDRDFLERAGLDMAGHEFNSGVLGIDLDLWRSYDIDSRIHSLAEKFKGVYKNSDQSLLNAALGSSVIILSDEFNTLLYPSDQSCRRLEKRIYHFIGSPKPWDLLGGIFSSHYTMWKDVYRHTAISKTPPLRYSSLDRTLRILRQYLNILARRLKR